MDPLLAADMTCTSVPTTAGRSIFRTSGTPNYNQNGTGGSFTFLAESRNVTITEYEVFELVPRVTYESVNKGLVDELEKCKDQMKGDDYELLSKALEISQVMVKYCSNFSKKDKSLVDQCEAADGEVQFVKRFLGRCHEDSVVRLNVGGQVMDTFRSTLLWNPCSQIW